MTCKNKFHRRNRRAGGEACAETTKEKLETSYDDDNHYFQKNDKLNLIIKYYQEKMCSK